MHAKKAMPRSRARGCLRGELGARLAAQREVVKAASDEARSHLAPVSGVGLLVWLFFFFFFFFFFVWVSCGRAGRKGCFGGVFFFFLDCGRCRRSRASASESGCRRHGDRAVEIVITAVAWEQGAWSWWNGGVEERRVSYPVVGGDLTLTGMKRRRATWLAGGGPGEVIVGDVAGRGIGLLTGASARGSRGCSPAPGLQHRDVLSPTPSLATRRGRGRISSALTIEEFAGSALFSFFFFFFFFSSRPSRPRVSRARKAGRFLTEKVIMRRTQRSGVPLFAYREWPRSQRSLSGTASGRRSNCGRSRTRARRARLRPCRCVTFHGASSG